MSIGGHHSPRARTETWLTPPALIDALGGAESFDLDPAAAVGQPWPTARRHLTVEDDGLLARWTGRIWLNPPYSTAVVGRFMSRMADHDHGTALIFARTETDAFFRYVWDRATALLFVRGRLHFHHADGARARANSGAPSVLIAYGQADAEILEASGIAGAFVPLLIPRLIAVALVDRTWSDVVADVVGDGPVRLSDLYAAVARDAKARGRRHYRAKVRQTLQRGPYRRVGRGLWEKEATA